MYLMIFWLTLDVFRSIVTLTANFGNLSKYVDTLKVIEYLRLSIFLSFVIMQFMDVDQEIQTTTYVILTVISWSKLLIGIRIFDRL